MRELLASVRTIMRPAGVFIHTSGCGSEPESVPHPTPGVCTSC